MSEYQYYEFQAIDRPLSERGSQGPAGFVDTGADHRHQFHQLL